MKENPRENHNMLNHMSLRKIPGQITFLKENPRVVVVIRIPSLGPVALLGEHGVTSVGPTPRSSPIALRALAHLGNPGRLQVP